MLCKKRKTGTMEHYFLATTGPDFMQPMYTRGFILCRAKIDLVIPVLKESLQSQFSALVLQQIDKN